MAEKKRRPELQFKGFTDPWEQRKLGEVAFSFEYGLNAAAKEFDGVNKYLRITDIDDSSRVFKDDDLTSPDTDLSTAGSYQLHDGEILFARTGASVGKSFIYRESYGLVYYAGFLIRAKVKPEYDSEFVFQNTLGASYEKYIQITSQRSGQPGVNAKEYAEYTFLVPDYTEQKKIGGFLHQIDNLITLHQRKYEKLVNVKKSMLEKMFPQNGSAYPEVRFSGFTAPWEQRKLSSVAEEVTRTDPKSTAPVMMITANNGFIEQSDRYAFNNAGESLKKYILLEKGEMAYNHGASKLRPYGSCFALTTAENARIPFVYHCFSVGENDPEFVSMELNGVRVESQLRRIVSSGARMDGLLNISYEEYSGVELMMPSVAEQKKLADYFRQIDNLITLHQRKLETLKHLKQSMLQKMFV